MRLRDVLEEVQQEIDAARTGINEADAKAAFIAPILAELGWRGLRRIRSEYPVDQGRMRLDYALIGSNAKPVALIEAKAPRESLESHVPQVLNYAFHEGVDICVLTTGISWWLYLPREKGSPAERRFAAMTLEGDDLVELVAILESCLEYEALISGAAEKRAKEMLVAQQQEQRVRKEIPRAWQRLLAGPNDFLIELLQEEVEEAIGLRPSKEQVVEALGNSAHASSDSPMDVLTVVDSQRIAQAEVGQRRQDALPQKSVRRRSSPTSSPRGFQLWGNGYSFTNWTALWLFVASEVYQRHEADFYRRVQASGKMRGPKRFYIHDSKSGMHTPVQIAHSPYYAETNNPKERSLKFARDLLEIFGYGGQDLVILPED